jgi:hypothetical protein
VAMVACVLRSGGDFDCGHVARLAYQVRQHVPAGTKFTCLTNDERVLDSDFGVRLKHDWPGWWSKIEVLKLPGPCLYLDLDVSIVGDLSPLLKAATKHNLIALRDFWVDGPHRINSSVMGWRGNVSSIYREFASSPEMFSTLYAVPEKWGDQRFIADTWAKEIIRWQDILPGMMTSYKLGALADEDMSNVRVLVSHGLPRPWAPAGADGWLVSKGLMH